MSIRDLNMEFETSYSSGPLVVSGVFSLCSYRLSFRIVDVQEYYYIVILYYYTVTNDFPYNLQVSLLYKYKSARDDISCIFFVR